MNWRAPARLLVALAVGDSPLVFDRYRVATITLDQAYTDETELVARLEALLGGRIHRIKVRRVDLVEATTIVEARYELPNARQGAVIRAAGRL